jgi:hypothetical protein
MDWISSAIQNANILALKGLSRQPEVMEWYYNAQERIATIISDHSSEVAFTWYYKDSALPVTIDDDNLQAAVVYVTVSSIASYQVVFELPHGLINGLVDLFDGSRFIFSTQHEE